MILEYLMISDFTFLTSVGANKEENHKCKATQRWQ